MAASADSVLMGQPPDEIGRRIGTRETSRLLIGIYGTARAGTRENRRRPGAWSALASVALFLLAVSGLWAGDVIEGGARCASVSVAADRTPRFEAPVTPWIHKSMPAPVKEKLKAGFELAVERVGEIEACGGLFTRLGANGLETLKASLYFPVDSYLREIEICGRNPAANSRIAENLTYTQTGARSVSVCRNFAYISTEDAAVAVIHEALHLAGLGEQPIDRLVMMSTEISGMVEVACAPDL